MNSGVTTGTNSLSYAGSMPPIIECATAMPASMTAPPAIIMAPIGREPYRRAIMNETPAMTRAGAAPIEMNWSIFGSGSRMKAPACSGSSCIKLYTVIISPANMPNSPRPAAAMYFSTAMPPAHASR